MMINRSLEKTGLLSRLPKSVTNFRVAYTMQRRMSSVSGCDAVVRTRRAVLSAIALAPYTPYFTFPRARASEGSSSKYDGYAPTYDSLDDGQIARSLGMDDQRRVLLSQARGMTLEVGVGTGINLQYYDPARLESLTAIDLSPGMLDQARQKRVGAAGASIPTTFSVANAERLPFEDCTFDTVVDTFSMCVYENPRQALAEMARVVKPGGTILLLEHSKSKSNSLLGAYQDITAGPAAAFGGKGCVYNQDVDAFIRGVQLGGGSDVRKGGLEIIQRTEFLAGVIVAYVVTRSL